MPRTQAARLAAVDGTDDDIDAALTRAGQRCEQIVRIAVARPERLEIERLDRAPRDRGVARLAVAQTGETHRQRREARQDEARGEALRWHRANDVRVIEPVSLGVVGASVDNGGDDGLEVIRMHLSVARHDRDDVRVERERAPVAGGDRSAHAARLVVPHEVNAAPLGLRDVGGRVLTAIVDDDDGVDPRGHAAHRLADEPRLVARWNHHNDGRPAKHRATYAFPAAERNGMAQGAMVAKVPHALRRLLPLGVVLLLVALGGAASLLLRMPPDTTPEGAYLRVATSLGRGDSRVVFSYLDDDAQHAAYTVRDYRKRATTRVIETYPEPEKSQLVAEWRAHADAPDGADVWVDLATKNGWIGRLRRDLSAVEKVEVEGDRATVQTARGTRYALRRRENGMWGLTMFTAALVAEAERAARDLEVVEASAADFTRDRRP